MYKSLSLVCLSLSIISSCKCGNDKTISDQTTQSTTLADSSNKNTANVTMDSSNKNGSATTNTTDSANTNASANNSANGKEESMYQKETHRTRRNGKYQGEFPEGSERILTDRDVAFLSQWGLKVMTNEIYARHGMRFSDPRLTQHFQHEGWYHGNSSDVSSSLTKVERENLAFLKDYKYKPGIQ